jgi:nucleoside-diphosphate-sugar epimerase
MIDGKEVEILNPEHKLDFTQVSDLAYAISLIIADTFPYIIDVGTGIPTSVESVATLLANHLKYPINKLKLNNSNNSLNRNIYVDPNSYLHTTGWCPSKNLNEHLIDYANSMVSLRNH